MHRVFNCGIGMVLIVAQEHRRHLLELFARRWRKSDGNGAIDGATATRRRPSSSQTTAARFRTWAIVLCNENRAVPAPFPF